MVNRRRRGRGRGRLLIKERRGSDGGDLIYHAYIQLAFFSSFLLFGSRSGSGSRCMRSP